MSLKECIRHVREGDECWMTLYKPLNSAAVKPHIKQNCATIYEITWELEAVTESQRHNDLKGGQKFTRHRNDASKNCEAFLSKIGKYNMNLASL